MSRIWQGVALGLCLLAAHASQAEPGPTVQYLIRNNVSLFSFGLYRIQVHIDSQVPSFVDQKAVYAVWYDYARNRIFIQAIIIEKGVPQTKALCRDIVRIFRLIGGINPNTGKPVVKEGSIFSSYFLPVGYGLKTTPRNTRQRLDNIFVIRVYLAPSGKKNRLGCRAPLLGKLVLFEG